MAIGGNIGFRKVFGGGGSGTFGPGVTLGFNIPFGVNAVNLPDVGRGRTTPDNTINRIKSQAVNGGLYSRPTLYNIIMTKPPKLKGWSGDQLRAIGFNCHQVAIPSNNIATKPIKTYGLKKEYAYNKLFDEITTGFYLSENMDEYHFFESWQDLMYKPNHSVGWYNDYISTLEIHQLSRDVSKGTSNDLGIVCKFILIDAYPKLISSMALDYSAANTIQKFTVNWTYRDMLIEPQVSKRTSGNLFKDFSDLNPLEKSFKLFRDFNQNSGNIGVVRDLARGNIRFT